MRIRSYRMLFRFFSYLSDKTNGASFFVNYKLMIGTLIIGLSGVSCNNPIQTGKQKNTMPADSELVRASRKNAINSMMKNIKPDTLMISCNFIPPVVSIKEEPIPMITCYLTDVVDMPKEPSQPQIYTYGMTDVSPVSAEGDLEHFRNWVQSNIQYPKNMLDDGVQGRVVLSFIIDEEGKLIDINILRSLRPEADQEAVRILSMSHPWTPGENKGQKVKVKIVLPVSFKLSQI